MMANREAGDYSARDAERYDSWYDRNSFAYKSEIDAVRALLPKGVRSLEVGVGTGRFAAELGVGVGLEPSRTMGDLARKRGIDVRVGTAERMPFEDGSFDVILMVAAICFLSDVQTALREAHRVLNRGGHIVVGMLDFNSPAGNSYAMHIADDDMLRNAEPLTVGDVQSKLKEAGFEVLEMRQTIFQEPHAMTAVDPVRDGSGDGLFVVIKAVKPAQAARGI